MKVSSLWVKGFPLQRWDGPYIIGIGTLVKTVSLYLDDPLVVHFGNIEALVEYLQKVVLS